MTEDKAYLPPAIRAQVVRHSVMQSNKCFNRNLMLNVPDVSPSYALLPDDALHSLIEKGKKSKLRKRSDVSQKNYNYKRSQGLKIQFLQFTEKSKGQYH